MFFRAFLIAFVAVAIFTIPFLGMPIMGINEYKAVLLAFITLYLIIPLLYLKDPLSYFTEEPKWRDWWNVVKYLLWDNPNTPTYVFGIVFSVFFALHYFLFKFDKEVFKLLLTACVFVSVLVVSLIYEVISSVRSHYHEGGD